MAGSHYQSLKGEFRSKSYLVVEATSKHVDLSDEAGAMRVLRQSKNGLFQSVLVMNVARALENFARIVDVDDRSFTLAELATIVGIPVGKLNLWLSDGVLVSTEREGSGKGKGKERLFTWRDAFAAGVCGSLRRQGLSLEILCKVRKKLGSKSAKELEEAQ